MNNNYLKIYSILIVSFFAAAMGCGLTAHGQESCPPTGLPIVENFDTPDSLPTCWERDENFDNPAMKAHIVGSPVYAGSGALMISSGADNDLVHEAFVMARRLSASPSGIRLKMKVRANQAGAVLMVGACESNSYFILGYGFQAVDTLTISSANTWIDYEVSFNGYTGQGDRLAFRMRQDMQGGQVGNEIYIDEMVVERCAVENLWVSHRSSDELTLHWTSVGDGTADLTVTPVGGGTPTTYTDVTSPFRITGLTPSTSYQLTLTPQCTGEAGDGLPKSTTGTTLPGPHEGLAYCESFENGNMDAGWIFTGGSTTSTAHSYTGTTGIYLAGGSGYAAMPQIALADGTPAAVSQLMLDMKIYPSGNGGLLEVGLTDYPEEAGTITPIDTIIPDIANAWNAITTSLTPDTATGRYLVLRAAGSAGIYLDDIRVGRCLLTGVAVAGRTPTSITIEWDAPADSGDVTIEPIVGGGGTITVTPSQSTAYGSKRRYTINGLALGSTHSYMVYGSCDPNHCGAATVSATTYAQDYTLPYCTDFEVSGTLPVDWQNSITHNSRPQIGTANHHSGSRALELSAYGGLQSQHSLTLLPPISTGTVTSVVVSFAAMSQYSGTIEVGTIAESGDESTFTVGAICSPTQQWGRYALTINTVDGYRYAIRYYHNGYGSRTAWIDDLEVNLAGVSNIYSSGERATGATLGWTPTGDTVDIQLRRSGSAWTATYSAASSPLVLDSLDEGVTYTYYVRCRANGTEGCWMYAGSFTTNSDALRADYCHPSTFTVGSTLWTLPFLEETSYDGLRVSLEANGSGTVQIGLMTDEGAAATFTQLASGAAGSGEWSRIVANLTGHESQGHYIALRCTGSAQVRHLRIARGDIISYSVTNIGANQATVSWSADGSTDSVMLVLSYGVNTVSDTILPWPAVSQITFDDLDAATDYTFTLTAINNASFRNCSNTSGTFTTLAADIAAGWCETFEGYSYGSLPIGWIAVSGNGSDPAIYYNSSSQRLRMTANSYTTPTVALPPSLIALNTLLLRADIKATGSYTSTSMLVAGIMTDASNPATFTAVDTVRPTTAERTCVFDLRRYTGNGHIIALRYLSPDGSGTLYIDNMGLEVMQVADLTVDRITDHSLRLAWQISPNLHIIGGGTDTVVNNAYEITIDGLSPNTAYSFTAFVPGSDSTSSCQTVSADGHTLIEPMVAPACLGLNDYLSANQLPYGWTRPYGTTPTSYTSTRYEGSRSLRFNTTVSSMVVSPMIDDQSVSNYYISFYLYNNYNDATMEVGVMTDPADTSTFTPLATYGYTGGWSRQEIALASAPAAARYIAFRHRTSGYSSAIAYIDYVMMLQCPMPTAYITNPRSNSLDVAWSYTGGGADSVIIEWGDNSIHTATSPYTITGLNQSTTYTVYVRPLCGDGDFSCHKLTLTQATLPAPVQMPHCQAFNNYNIPSAWHTWSDSGSVNLTITTPDASRALRMYAYASASVTAILPQISTAGFCPTLDSIYLSFRLSTTDSITPGSQLQIGVVTDILSSSSYTQLLTVSLDGVNREWWTWRTLGLPSGSIAPGFLAFKLIAPSGSSSTVTVDELCVDYCFATDINMTEVTPTSATFEWTSHGAESLTVIWDGGNQTFDTSPFTINGFDPNQSYEFTFRAQCPCEYDHYYYGLYGPRMPALPMYGLPICYDFEQLEVGFFPIHWRRSGGSHPEYPRIANILGGNKVIDLYTLENYPLTMALEPLPDSVGNVIVSLRVWCNNDNPAVYDCLFIGTMSNAENPATFTPLQSLRISTTETWQTFHINIPQPSDRYIALQFSPEGGQYHMYIDDISVAPCAASSLTATDDAIDITTLGEATGTLLTITNLDNPASARLLGPVAAGHHTFSSLGLAADSAYSIHASSLCGDTISCTDESINVGIRHELPYCVDFSGDDLQPYGWEVLHRNTPSYPRIAPSGYFMIPSATLPDSGDIVVLPMLPMGQTLGGLHLRLTITHPSYDDLNYSYLEICSYTGGVLTSLAVLHNTELTQTHYITLPASAANRLALHAHCTNGMRYLSVSDLQLTVYPEPPAYTLSQTGYRQQHIYWSPATSASVYDIEYGPYGFTPGSGTTVHSDTGHAVFFPLDASTRYQFYFIDTAGNRFCYPHEFTTLPPAQPTPWCSSNNISIASGDTYILPESTDTISGLSLLLTWQCGSGGHLVIGAVSDISDLLTFTPLDTLTPTTPNIWQRDSINLWHYSDTGHFVALRFEGAMGYVNQITLQQIPQPRFHVLSSSMIEATVDASAVDYYLGICPHGQPQSTCTIHHATTSPYYITGLSMYTDYDIYTLSDSGTTCAPPVTMRTHLDIQVPHCTDLTSLPAGWLCQENYRMMPYPLIDSIAKLHIYINGSGNITIGATSALDDTASFVALRTMTLTSADSHIYLAPYASSIGDHHYLAFRLSGSAAIGGLNIQTVARPEYYVLSSSAIRATLPDSLEADYYIEACLAGQPQGTGTIYHATSSPYIIEGLTMYTWYDLYVRADSAAVTCDPPVTLRTHLDIEPPYCNLEGSDGWYTSGSFHVMPYAIIDTMISLYATFTSQGSITIGVQGVLTDTNTFVPLADYQNSTLDEHLIHLADYSTLVGNRHYLAFRYTSANAAVNQVYLHTCPVPSATLHAFDVVRFDQDSAGIDYWIAYGDNVVHADTNPYYINNLAQNTLYQFSIRCDSATTTCIPPLEILTGVQISAPHCADLSSHRFTIDNLPDGWFTLAGGEYVIMPIIDIDSVSRLFMRLRYRLSEIGTAINIGVMTSPYDASTFSSLITLNDISPTFRTFDYSFANYTDTGLYLAFHVIGSNPQSAILDRVELQTIPFANYHLTHWDSILVLPTPVETFPLPCYISYGDSLILADSLPWAIGNLPADTPLQFNIQASDTVLPCIAPTLVQTTHLAETPLCDLTAELYSSTALWCGPELAEPNISSMHLRATATTVSGATRIAVGTLVCRNVDSTFHPVDTITLSTTGTVVADFSHYNGQGHFLALRLIEGGATLDGIILDHCLTPPDASLSLVRHNIVRLHQGITPGAGDLWLLYGPEGGSQTVVHIDTLPTDFTLANSTTYTFTLACDSLTAAASCAQPLYITTLDTPPTLSWCEPFDNVAVSSLPTDWRMATAQNVAQKTDVSTSTYHTASRSLHMHSTIGHNSVVVLPDLGLDSLNGVSLSLWLRTDNTALGLLEVGVIFNPSDPETFRPLRSLDCRQANIWERHLVDLADAPAGAYFLALRCRGVNGTNNCWIDDLHVAECGANSVSVSRVEANQITLRWRQTGNPSTTVTVIPSGEASYTVNIAPLITPDPYEPGYFNAVIDNLSPLTNYVFAFNATCGGSGFCTTDLQDTCRVFTPEGGNGCIDPTNFAASYTTCFFGSYGDPVADTGSIDLGYASALSRHTVHYDLDEMDPRTGNNLRTVPEGATSSVRLGNWSHNSTHPEAEAISYGLTVDTADFNLLILRYAAVLQDPNHSPDKQPRFSLELLDATGHVLDSSCGRADFIANYQLGWNIASNNVLWKDWTTVGIDLTPYAGQTIYVRLTTRDCNEGSHYGYAYFTLECLRRNITTSNCGVVENNQLTAPSGFNYYWYSSASADTISTDQTIVVPTDNTLSYLCQVSFVDNPGCHFTMTAYAGTRYPLSLFDYSVSLATCSFDVVFTNQSTISSDGITPVGTGEGVESARWILGNGDTMDSYNASVNYPEGTYNVSLITGIAADACLDTLTIPLNLVLPPTEMEITGITERCLNQAADTLWLNNVVQLVNSSHAWTLADTATVGTYLLKRYWLVMDSASYAPDSHLFTVEAVDSVGCLRNLSHTVVVHPSYHLFDTLHLCSLMLPYSWRDTSLASPSNAYTMQHSSPSIHRYTSFGCDSVMHLDLTLYDNASFTPRDTAYGTICDNSQFYFSDSLLTPDISLTHNIGVGSLVYTDSLFSSIGCDSLSTIVLTVNPTYDHHLYDTVCTNQSYTWGTPTRQMLPTADITANRHAADTLVGFSIADGTLPPDTLFTDSLNTTGSCDSLSSLHLHLLPSYSLHYYDTICNARILSFDADSLALWEQHQYPFEHSAYDTTGDYTHQFTADGCDSLRTLHLEVLPTHNIHLYDTIYDGDTYSFETSTYDTTGIYPHTFATYLSTQTSHNSPMITPWSAVGNGCDSLRTLHLQRWPRTYIDTVLCFNSLPLVWNGLTFAADGVHSPTGSLQGEGVYYPAGMTVMADSVRLQWSAGGDSLVVMTVVVRDTSSTVDMVHTCDSLIWSHLPDTTFRQTTDQPYRYLLQLAPFDTTGLSNHLHGGPYLPYNIHLAPFAVQCDSVRHLDLTVDYTHYSTDYQIVCDSLHWPSNPTSLTATRNFYRDTLGHYGPLGSFSVSGPVDTLTTVGGCDSVVALDLNVHYATYQCDIDTFCWHEYYFWRTQFAGDTTAEHWPVTDSFYLSETLQTHRFVHRSRPSVGITCDSTLAIQLTQMARPQLQLTDSIDCLNEVYHLGIITDVPYTRWTDNRTPLRRVNEPVIQVAPDANTIYRAYVDYHAAPLCPLTDSLSVRPVLIPEAVMKVNPEALKYDALEFDAYDLSVEAPRSIHPTDADIWTRGWYVNGLLQDESSWHLHHLAAPDRDTLQLALRVFNGQCADTAIRLIPINRVSIFAPNVFTPLRDNNQRFIVVGTGIRSAELFVYNREGLLIYQTSGTAPDGNILLEWDGRRKDGTLCLQANYVWKLVYHTIDPLQNAATEVGNVLLLR
ncbi:MAG: hypothetical protein IKR83_06135 [Bacteroidales bacterium]|nr:hypothetical protein [Bacteroidales bacterium]